MRQREVICPYCEAEIPLELDSREGEEVYCSYCQMKMRLEMREKKLEAVEDEE